MPVAMTVATLAVAVGIVPVPVMMILFRRTADAVTVTATSLSWCVRVARRPHFVLIRSRRLLLPPGCVLQPHVIRQRRWSKTSSCDGASTDPSEMAQDIKL